MDVFEAVKTMLAVRSYSDRPVGDEEMGRILEAARLTGSSQNKQHWDFVVVREREMLERLAELAPYGSYISGAAAAIAVVVPDRSVGYIDGARAVQDMMLVAWELGIGSNWVGRVNTAEMKEALGVPQEKLLLTVMPLGYPQQELGKGIKDRKPLQEIVHGERFGRPYEGN